jgi:hypothetical protein
MKSNCSCQNAWPPVQRRSCTHQKPRANLSDPQTHHQLEDHRSPHRPAHFLRILKPDVATTLTVQRRGNRRCNSPRAPNSHSHAARVLVSTPNHDEGGQRGLQCNIAPSIQFPPEPEVSSSSSKKGLHPRPRSSAARPQRRTGT